MVTPTRDTHMCAKKNEDAADVCTRMYLGLSWAEYRARVGGLLPSPVDDPPLPAGMVDAMQFLEREHAVREELDACRQRAAALEALGEGNDVPIATVRSLLNKHHEWNNRARFEQERAQLTARERALREEHWRYLNTVTVVDAVRFRQELRAILDARQELLLARHTQVAERILARRVS